jgi:phenylpropionate dioxygenase-like ring-hydroxylating dioxygenase large terminal subunit
MADGHQTRETPQIHKSITPDGMLLDCWYFAAPSAQIKPGQQFRQMIAGEPVLLGRTKTGEVFAIRDVCAHRAVALSAGKQVVSEGLTTVECPFHGWRFGTDGVCRHLPSLVEGHPYDPTRIRVRRYPSHEAHGLVFVWMSADPRFDGVPDLAPPSFGLKADKPKFAISRVFPADMENAIIGFIDPGHVPFVHNQWWWRPPSAGFKIKEKKFEPSERGWTMSRHTPSSNSLGYRLVFGGNVTTEIVFLLPGYRWEVIENETSQFVTLSCITPIDATNTLVTQVFYWTKAPLLDLMKPLLVPSTKEFLDQDGRMVELQKLGLPYAKAMIWIDDIDTQAKWYHKLKREWVASRAEGRPFENPIQPTVLRWRS